MILGCWKKAWESKKMMSQLKMAQEYRKEKLGVCFSLLFWAKPSCLIFQ